MNWTETHKKECWKTPCLNGEIFLHRGIGGEHNGMWIVYLLGDLHYYDGSYNVETIKETAKQLYVRTLQDEINRLINDDECPTLTLAELSAARG